ncbi:MAG: aldolase/citrate lyase family protein [Caulobacteraceae bacterium]
MPAPKNRFKEALLAGRRQLGFWCSLSSPYAAEAVAGAGYDWLLLDTEHSPNDVLGVLAQLQAIAAYPVTPIVRPTHNDVVLLKRYLDFGVQTVLLPYIQSADEARVAVQAMRYAPEGIRGVSTMTRANNFGRIGDYAATAADELCLLVQVETTTALDHLEEIAGVEGVDGVFIGPADLAASLGYPGEPGRPEVKAVIEQAIGRIRQLGKPAGILTGDAAFARRCIELGALFTAVGIDASVLVKAADTLARDFSDLR